MAAAALDASGTGRAGAGAGPDPAGAAAALLAHVAACVDRRPRSRVALDEAARLRGLAPGRLSAVHVARRRPGGDDAERPPRWLRRAAAARGAEPVLLRGRTVRRLAAWAGATGAGLLVAASEAGPLQRAGLGGVARRLAVDAPCPVLLLPPGVPAPAARPGGAYAHVACCVDDSPASERALATARALRALGPGRLSVVHAAPRPLLPAGSPLPDIADDDDAWLRARAAAVPEAQAVLLTGHAPAAVREWAARARPDLLVAAAHRGRRERLLLGSVAGALAVSAPCPVMITR